MSANTVALAYLIASVFFILALKGLSSPLTARRGNLFGMVGMAIAVVTTLTDYQKLGADPRLHRLGWHHRRGCGAARANDRDAGTGCIHALAGGLGSGISSLSPLSIIRLRSVCPRYCRWAANWSCFSAHSSAP